MRNILTKSSIALLASSSANAFDLEEFWRGAQTGAFVMDEEATILADDYSCS